MNAARSLSGSMMRNASMASSPVVYGYWGKPTAMIDWCEPNYEYSFYIAEFWNTISNLLFVLLGIFGLCQTLKQGFEWRFHMQFLGVIITGVGSAMFHGTLQLVHQQCDETPMVWTMLIAIYIIYDKEIRDAGLKDKVVIPTLIGLGIAFAVAHAYFRSNIMFQVIFGTLATLNSVRLCMHYNQTKDPRARAVARCYVRNSLIGFTLWLTDLNMCHHIEQLPVNPQGHAWWHLFMGIASYYGPLFMQYIRYEQLQRNPKVVSSAFGLDTIVIDGCDDASNTTKAKTL
jgi:dihydroceramidase